MIILLVTILGLSLYSAIIIQENNTLVKTYRVKGSDKYSYSIIYDKNKFEIPIISDNSLYNSEEEAYKEGISLMKAIKETDFSLEKKKLESLLY